MNNKFLLIMGPSGAGKSTIIHNLRGIDNRFEYISPYITRELRVGETDKIPVTKSQLRKLNNEGKILAINRLYGVSYATPITPINKAFLDGKFPILDWPVDKLNIMEIAFPGKLFKVYLEPPNLESLEDRLSDGRDLKGKRFSKAKNELAKLLRGEFDNLVDFRIVNEQGNQEVIAKKIFYAYLRSINKW